MRSPEIPAGLEPTIDLLQYEVREQPTRQLAEKLQHLIRQYPDVPVLKNFLMLVYKGTGQQSRVMPIIDQTIAQHPTYVPALASKVLIRLIPTLFEDVETLARAVADVEQLFGGPVPHLNEFHPNESLFHASVVGQYYSARFYYQLATGETDQAEQTLLFLRDLNYHDKAYIKKAKRAFGMVQMRSNLARFTEGRETTVSIQGRFRAEDQQTRQAPAFNHPETKWFYQHGLAKTDNPLPADKQVALLALPRETFTADLSAVLLDTMYRYKYFSEQNWNPRQQNFPIHALFFMTELRATECLDAVLETLRQDEGFREHWWGDYLEDAYIPYLRKMWPQHAQTLKAFILEPDLNTYHKSVLSESLRQEAAVNPEVATLAPAWYAEVLQCMVDHATDDAYLDHAALGFVITDITMLQLTDLLPLIRTAFRRGIVDVMIQGDLEAVERLMEQPDRPDRPRPNRSLEDQYAYYHDPAAFREANPRPLHETVPNPIVGEILKKEAEWEAYFGGETDHDDDDNDDDDDYIEHRPDYAPALPVRKQPEPGRNDKVSVRYKDGKVMGDVKYKKVEADVKAGECILLCRTCRTFALTMGRLVAIDYGNKRTGLAVTDPLQIIATALETVPTHLLLDRLKAYAAAEPVEAFVVGWPTNTDGTDTHTTPQVRALLKKLKLIFPEQTVYQHDERFTSKMAMQAMIAGGTSKKDRRVKGNIDMVSATIILQSFMESKK